MWRARLRTIIGISCILGLIIVMHSLGWLGIIERFVFHSIIPISRSLYTVKEKQGVELAGFTSVEELAQAYISLQHACVIKEKKDIDVVLLQQENASLREQLRFVQRTSVTSVGVDVIGKNIDQIGSTLLINRGEKDGVAEGQPVVAEDGILIGKVAKVYSDSAIVRLINDNHSRVAATILNEEKSIGLVEGGYGISVRMDFIPQNEVITVGDMIITSGLEARVPRGLLIGKVESVEKEVYEPFQRAILSPLLPLDRLTTVSVLL